MKKALIFYGGWDGHTPKETAELFRDLLVAEDFQVTMSDSLDVLNDHEELKQYDLILPMVHTGTNRSYCFSSS